MKKAILWLAWGTLMVIYLATIGAHCFAGHYYYVAFAALCVGCCSLLFFAEGFEISFSMIFPQREQAETDIRESFRSLDAEFVLAQRQVIVVATITILSLTTVFEWIYIPGLGKVSSHGAPAWFSGLFTTLNVLWAAQVLPKRLAARSPNRFWRLSKWLLKPILTAGRIFDLPAPADDLVRLWERVFPSQEQNPEHGAAPMQVAQLWASCDCAVCNPHTGFAGISSSRSSCGCAVCDPVAPQAA